ncbi:DoxX family protein [Nonlabens ponticola]|uniref:DoxX family protein n=1 Tax=Nonlabens ponticola TaxID=2496866 RepID=A0A3S9MVN3_9FLAO|nr:DoxX family protein [Nonlabens ponticola]AZQ43194.1 DoxX family protein [Nonlabens ponticola]
MKIAYWIVTVLFCLMMTFSAGMYLFNSEYIFTEFVKLGFPTWIVYPLAGAKLLGVATILIRKNRSLVEWAYAGFFFNILLAMLAHIVIVDGEQWGALVALIMAMSSYFLGKKARPL